MAPTPKALRADRRKRRQKERPAQFSARNIRAPQPPFLLMSKDTVSAFVGLGNSAHSIPAKPAGRQNQSRCEWRRSAICITPSGLRARQGTEGIPTSTRAEDMLRSTGKRSTPFVVATRIFSNHHSASMRCAEWHPPPMIEKENRIPRKSRRRARFAVVKGAPRRRFSREGFQMRGPRYIKLRELSPQ